MRIVESELARGLGPSSFLSLPSSCPIACRLDSESGPLFAQAAIEYRTAADLLAPATIPAVADAPSSKTTRRRRALRLSTDSQLKTMTRNRREQSA